MINKLLKPVKSNYDYVTIECPPSVGLLTVNAMVASDTILLPLQGEYFAYKEVDRLLRIVQEVRESLNENLEIGGVFISWKRPPILHCSRKTCTTYQWNFPAELIDYRIKEIVFHNLITKMVKAEKIICLF